MMPGRAKNELGWVFDSERLPVLCPWFLWVYPVLLFGSERSTAFPQLSKYLN